MNVESWSADGKFISDGLNVPNHVNVECHMRVYHGVRQPRLRRLAWRIATFAAYQCRQEGTLLKDVNLKSSRGCGNCDFKTQKPRL